jgi:hypothetical protein
LSTPFLAPSPFQTHFPERSGRASDRLLPLTFRRRRAFPLQSWRRTIR